MKKTLNLLIIMLSLFSVLRGQDLKLMTYNLRYDNPGDGENAWPARKENLLSQVLFYGPDVLGTQEGLEHQVEWLNEKMTDYKVVGEGRADVKEKGKGEFSAIFYNATMFKALKNGTFWLSETPDKPSRGWDASLNRICTYVLLQDRSTGTGFWVFNTHFDHRGRTARKGSAKLILQKIGEFNKDGLPVFLMGDFNATPEDEPVKLIVKELCDSRNMCDLPPFGPEGTYNGFDVCKNPEKRIDYIFVSRQKVAVKKYAVLAEVKDLKFPSDHLPVYIEVRFIDGR